MRVYIAGPMRGIFEFNYPAFYNAEARLVDAGYKPFNPARHDVEQGGFEYRGLKGTEDLSILGYSLSAALADDMMWIARNADAICVLDGWREARGAFAEVALAAALDLPGGCVEQFLAKELVPAAALTDRNRRDATWDQARLDRLMHDVEHGELQGGA